MKPQKEGSSVTCQPAETAYGSYEGTQTSSARQQYESSYEQEAGERPSGKVYPLRHDNTNTLRFALAVIALGLLLLFGLLFVVMIGGTIGWASFVVAGIALFIISGVGIDKIR